MTIVVCDRCGNQSSSTEPGYDVSKTTIEVGVGLHPNKRIGYVDWCQLCREDFAVYTRLFMQERIGTRKPLSDRS